MGRIAGGSGSYALHAVRKAMGLHTRRADRDVEVRPLRIRGAREILRFSATTDRPSGIDDQLGARREGSGASEARFRKYTDVRGVRSGSSANGRATPDTQGPCRHPPG